MKRKLSFLEFGLLMVPLLAFALLTAQSQIRNAWNTWFWGGTVLKGDVYGLGFSPDSKTLAICTWDHNVRKGRLDFMDIPSQRVRNSVDLRGPGNVIWSPDGKRLVLSNGLGCAIWDTTLNRWLLRRRAVPRASEYVSGWQSPDVLRLRIATYARPRSKPLWQEARLDVRSGALQTSTPATTVPAEEKPLRVSPDGRWKIAISDTRYISKPATKRAGWWVTGHQEGARLQLWDKQTGKLARTFDGDMFTDAAFQSKTTVAAYARIHSNGGLVQQCPAPLFAP
jgi:WD40 repeat protein